MKDRAPFRFPASVCVALALSLVGSVVAQADEAAFPDFERTENFIDETLEGWTLKVHRKLREEDRDLGDRAIEQVRSHLLQVKTRVPEKVLPKLQAVPIWLNVRPNAAAEYHPSREWLAGHGHNPEKAKCIEVGNAENYLRYSRDQQSILLHELAHAYHDQVLGFDEKRIRERFEQAKEEGLYDSVMKMSGKVDRHYALSNEKEFFAEMTEAFFAANDFYPFVRPELRRHDPATFDLLVEIWEEAPEAKDASPEGDSEAPPVSSPR